MAMSLSSKYGVRELTRNFPNARRCLEFIFNLHHSRRCGCGGVISLRKGRKVFRCGRCHIEISPLKNTIFEKSSTPLVLWFHALLLFSNAKSGLSAKELERNLAVTYKCAWRVLSLVRSRLTQSLAKLSGIVESDGAYIGGKRTCASRKDMSQARLDKAVVRAAIERDGRARAKVVPGTGATATSGFIFDHVKTGSQLMTDEDLGYWRASQVYERKTANHSKKEYARGDVHVNSVESFWAHVKRSLSGTHKSVSKAYLQSYLDAFVFHYNNAGTDRSRFETLLRLVSMPSRAQETPSSS